MHKCMVPPDVEGAVIDTVPDGEYTIDETLITLELANGSKKELTMTQHWPIPCASADTSPFPGICAAYHRTAYH